MQAGGMAPETVPHMDAPLSHTEPKSHVMAVRFTGSGSEYFRIWIVNLLLILVTLTLYLPFARARRMAYFQNNTRVGDDPLGFHADPWKMFRGYLVVALLGGAYWAVTNFLPAFGWLALLAFMAVWPMLWRASLQFRLRNTSWRGVRLAFLGDIKGAYGAMLPYFFPALFFVLLLPNETAGEPMLPGQNKLLFGVAGVVVLAFVVLAPWFWKRMKSYQHSAYAFAQERTAFTATSGQFYKLYLKITIVSLLVLAGVATAVGVAMAAFAGLNLSGLKNLFTAQGSSLLMLLIGVMVLVTYVVVPLLVGSYVASRMQNLLWSHTQSPRLRLRSDLRMATVLRVSCVNWLLIALTLGLYWPFAKVRLARVKLEALSVEAIGNVEDWVAEAREAGNGALGDAAGDFFGIDVGL